MPEINTLIVIDMQNDFIDGALSNKDATAIIPQLANIISSWKGPIYTTQDTHHKDDYFNSQEGRRLPTIHCEFGTNGHELHPDIEAALNSRNALGPAPLSYHRILKDQFAADWTKVHFPYHPQVFTLCGVCTDICVISNAFALKASFPDATIRILNNLCAGTSPENHTTAIAAMKNCQMEIC